MSKIECLFALRDHYDLIAQRMPLKMRLATSARSLRAGQSDGQNEAPIALELAAIDKLNKEGKPRCCCATPTA